MTTYTSTRDSYSAINAQGEYIHFTVLAELGTDTFITAKKLARQNKWKKVKFFSFIGI